jgi:phage tail sheath protein FI
MDRGITVTEIAPMDQPIDASTETTAAFVGRALRGPLNTPVLIDNFSMFRRQFGGTWRHSSLGPAVQQFFDHGGKKLYIVRVASNARGATICLPAVGGTLVLQALAPGSTEQIRAAIDYDGIADEEHFNLTVQRIATDTGLVADQEIYLRLSCREDSKSYILDNLLNSALVSVQAPLPQGRPARTTRPGVPFGSSYIGHAQQGTDGDDLTDYDLVGSVTRSSGIFALNQVDHFDILYLPPPGKHTDIGLPAALAAERYCRKRGALFIMDPPQAWNTVDNAIAGLARSDISSPNVLAYFPRVIVDGDEDSTPRVAGAAIAGLLCRLDRQHGPWEDLDQPGFGFDKRFVPECELSISQAKSLVRRGVNVISSTGSGRAMLCGSVTTRYGRQLERSFAILSARRLCLSITNHIERAIRWSVFEPNETRVAERIQGQVHAYMSALADQGAFADDSFMVQCDARLRTSPADPYRGVAVLLAFRPAGCDEPAALTLHQTVSGCRVARTAFAPALDLPFAHVA